MKQIFCILNQKVLYSMARSKTINLTGSVAFDPLATKSQMVEEATVI
jgi:hypothetical protein